MNIALLDGTTQQPLQHIGKLAGVCWSAPLDNPGKNRNRAINCIKSGHGRVLELVNVEVVISGMSARAMRELYTHIGGAPTRLQESTRYVDEKDFGYFTPPKVVSNPAVQMEYDKVMEHIASCYGKLVEMGIPKEDAANILPLGMESKMVWKLNLRMLIDFMHSRLCTRAYHEIRKFAHELKNILSIYDEEWAWIVDNLFVPKCEQYTHLNKTIAFCTEDKCCGRHPNIVSVEMKAIDNA